MFQRVSRRKIGRVGQKESRMMVHGGLEICRTSKSTSSQYSLLSWICISTSRTEFSSFNGPATSMQRMVNSSLLKTRTFRPKTIKPNLQSSSSFALWTLFAHLCNSLQSSKFSNSWNRHPTNSSIFCSPTFLFLFSTFYRQEMSMDRSSFHPW